MKEECVGKKAVIEGVNWLIWREEFFAEVEQVDGGSVAILEKVEDGRGDKEAGNEENFGGVLEAAEIGVSSKVLVDWIDQSRGKDCNWRNRLDEVP